MKRKYPKITLKDFSVFLSSKPYEGKYIIEYTSPVTLKTWRYDTESSIMVDELTEALAGDFCITRKRLNQIKQQCKICGH